MNISFIFLIDENKTHVPGTSNNKKLYYMYEYYANTWNSSFFIQAANHIFCNWINYPLCWCYLPFIMISWKGCHIDDFNIQVYNIKFNI